jgi:iron complex transport system substrate-binding protein
LSLLLTVEGDLPLPALKRLTLLTVALALSALFAACTDAPSSGLPTPWPTATPASAYPLTVTDDSGTTLTVLSAPRRVVSASLAADEVLADLVTPDRLAAISYDALDESVSNLAGRTDLADVERLPAQPTAADIAAYRPDLVIIDAGMPSAVIDDLRGRGITVYVYDAPSTLALLNERITALGALVGEPERAAGLVDGVTARIAEIQRQFGNVSPQPPRVLYYEGDGRVAGRGTVPDQIIQLAGGTNVAAELDGWATVTDADVVALNPVLIITPPGDIDNAVEANPAFADVAAVKKGPVMPISNPEMLAQSQYMVRGVEAVAKILYPDRVSD